ncbi:cobalamin biosynthesis protein [Archaeoglobus neptunius]|uniref:cobalamin biosynthesis protein n=1 Tax=Archaeoglobus neptunius TaxID=2798580 RepID=UPI001928F925|nr:cobalamin biosynthesis protein [Archaeoglobus neptunius]
MRGHISTRKIAILCFKKDRDKLKPLKDILDERYSAEFIYYSQDIWDSLLNYGCIIAYLAAGIVVRGLCGKLKGKWVDPAVIVLDKPLKHAVVLMGGHHGGNEVARVLESAGIEAVITTAMEFSHGLSVGVGFRRDVEAEDIIRAINLALEEVGAGIEDVRVIATVEAKKGSVIVDVADRFKRPLIFVSAEEINAMDIRETEAVKIGVRNVAEACAIFSSNTGELLLPKRVYGGVTVAIAR